MNSKLAQFNKKTYLNLETFRKSGVSVKTPVWFVQDGNTLYVRTVDGSGKVKRVRNNSMVNVVPCSMNGEPQGEWENAIAVLIDGDEAKHVEQLLDRKYGLMGKLFGIQGKIKKTAYATIKIKAEQQ